jgi:hypothetical protein
MEDQMEGTSQMKSNQVYNCSIVIRTGPEKVTRVPVQIRNCATSLVDLRHGPHTKGPGYHGNPRLNRCQMKSELLKFEPEVERL